MATDLIGNSYDVGHLVAVCMHASAARTAVVQFALVESFKVHGRGENFEVVVRPYAESFDSYGSLGPTAKLRTHKARNIIALPGKTLADVQKKVTR